MINKIEDKIRKTAKIFNNISSIGVVVAMVLVVLNIILRRFFKSPIIGAYEYPGFITALIVGFALSYCLLVDAHIFIDFVTTKFKEKNQRIIHITTSVISFLFMSVFSYYLFRYGVQLFKSNSVSPTTQTPLYIFVLLLGVCFVLLSLSILVKIKDYIEGEKK